MYNSFYWLKLQRLLTILSQKYAIVGCFLFEHSNQVCMLLIALYQLLRSAKCLHFKRACYEVRAEPGFYVMAMIGIDGSRVGTGWPCFSHPLSCTQVSISKEVRWYGYVHLSCIGENLFGKTGVNLSQTIQNGYIICRGVGFYSRPYKSTAYIRQLNMVF